LQSAVLDKGFLYGMQDLALGHALNRQQRGIACFKGQHGAGAHWTAIEQHSAGAADLHIARLFCACQAEPIANKLDQCQVGLNQDIMRMSIDRDVDGQHLPRGRAVVCSVVCHAVPFLRSSLPAFPLMAC
jgi:hypothetical protein